VLEYKNSSIGAYFTLFERVLAPVLGKFKRQNEKFSAHERKKGQF